MRRSRDRRGGGVQTPPPQQVVENPEAQQGAGKVIAETRQGVLQAGGDARNRSFGPETMT